MKNILIICTIAIFASCTDAKKDGTSGHEHDARQAGQEKYTCPMHPHVVKDGPGSCPVCGMNLVPVSSQNASNSDLMLSDSQMKLANITTQKAAVHAIGQTITVNAKLVVDEEQTVVISSRVAGRIEKLFFKESGRLVRTGDPLYEIYSEALLTFQREYLLALEQNETLGKAEKRYASFVKAAENKLLLYGLNKKQIEQLAAAKSVQPRITFLAPAGGIIQDFEVAEGQYVAEGDRLYRIENIGSLWLEAELYPHETRYVKAGDRVTVRVTGFESESVTATINFLSPEYRANSQITIMRANVSNPGLRYKPGMQAQVFFTHSARKALAVPADAVIRDGKGTHVYVLAGQNTFQPRMVKTGVEDFERVEIVSGLQENETVAITGAYLLYSELILKKGTDPMAGHQHQK